MLSSLSCSKVARLVSEVRSLSSLMALSMLTIMSGFPPCLARISFSASYTSVGLVMFCPVIGSIITLMASLMLRLQTISSDLWRFIMRITKHLCNYCGQVFAEDDLVFFWTDRVDDAICRSCSRICESLAARIN